MQTILAVDDREDKLSLVEQFLSEHYHVVAVNSRAMAIKFLNQRLPDLVLINMGMPRLEGLRLSIELRENEKWEHIPSWEITPLFDAEDMRACVQTLLSAEIKEDGVYLPVRRDSTLIQLPIADIESVEVYQDVAIVRLERQEIASRMTAQQISRYLGNCFLRIGDGLFVNKSKISKVAEGIVYMESGREHVLPSAWRRSVTGQIKRCRH